MLHYGLIGKKLGHSFSPDYFAAKFRNEQINADYTAYETDDIAHLPDWDGWNVTIPYKQEIIPHLDTLDDAAREIGAVNVVKRQDNLTIGYNTDWIGFVRSIRPLLSPSDRKALVLGTGGVAQAVAYGVKRLGLEFTMVSRKSDETRHILGYGDLEENIIREHSVIINCTPLGMYPDINHQPDIPYMQIGRQHLLFDCIYNPEETRFLRHGREAGARTKNGYEMLIIQAEEAWKIWNEK